MSESNEEQEKYITVSRAYLLGMNYIQEAVVDNIKDPKKVESYKEKFFELCDMAMEDIFMASAKPEVRALNLLSEINKERLMLLRYTNDLKNDDPQNPIIRRLEQYATLSLQTYGQIITAYNQHQLPPVLRKTQISIPTVSKNTDINPDNCELKVTDFVPPSTKEKNVSYTIQIYHALTSTKTELYSGKIDKNSTIQTTFSGIDKYRQEPSKLPRLARSKFIFEITQKSKSIIKKKETSLGEYKLPMHLFENEFTAQKQFKITGGSGSFNVEAHIREPLLHPKEKTEIITIRISESLNSNIRAATTSNVPQPTIQQAPAAAKSSGNTRNTTNVPKPAPMPNTNAAPPNPQSESDQKKLKAKALLLKNSFPLLPKEELLQFIDTTSIELMEAIYKENIVNLKKLNLEMPDEYTRQNLILLKKKEKLENDISSGKITIDDFKIMLQNQIKRNRLQMKKTKDINVAAFLGKSADNMEEQLKSFEEGDDDDEE